MVAKEIYLENTWVDIYTELGVTKDKTIYIQNKSSGPLHLWPKDTAPLDDKDGLHLRAGEYTTLNAGGESILASGLGRIYVSVIEAAVQPDSGLDPLTELMVTAADTPQLDAFSRLRVSQAFTLFDSQQEYGLDTRTTWDAAAFNGTATLSVASSNGSVSAGSNLVGPRNVNTRMVPITCSGTEGHYAILQTRQYTRYIPGKSHLIFITGVFSPTATCEAAITLRSATSGSPVDNETIQGQWNIDKFDGTGPSKITLDLSKTQILFVQAQWLGVGRVIVGFDVDGILYPAHQFLNANRLTVPYTQSFNLPVRLETRTTGGLVVSRIGYFDSNNGVFLKTTGTTAGGTIHFVCTSVQSEGGEELRGFPQSGPPTPVAVNVTTRRPILSIRPKATYNGVTNRAHIKEIEYALRTISNDASIDIVLGGTLTGASWASAGNDSVAEYDTSATAITGGVVIDKDFSLTATKTKSALSSSKSDLRNPLVISKIDELTGNQIPVSIVATSLSGTATIIPSMTWKEQVI